MGIKKSLSLLKQGYGKGKDLTQDNKLNQHELVNPRW